MAPSEARAERQPDSESSTLEWILSTVWRRAAATAALVFVLALLSAVPVYDALESRGREVELLAILGSKLIEWAPWGLLAEPIVRLAGWIRDRSPNWPVGAGGILVLSLVCAFGAASYDARFGPSFPFPSGAGYWDRARRRPPAAEQPPLVEAQDSAPAPLETRAPLGSAARAEGRPEARGEREWERPEGEGRDWPERADFLRRMRIRRVPRELALVWILLGLGAGIESFLVARHRKREASQLALRTARLEAELANSHLNSLRRQLHPHFLFNALHSVGGLVRSSDSPGALRALSALGQLLRTMLEHGDDQILALRDELRLAQRYLEIETIRFGDRLRVELEVDEDCLDIEVPSLLLLPLVENAVRHGIAPRESGGSIRLRARREQDSLQLIVEDDGPGFPAEVRRRVEARASGQELDASAPAHTSLGLANERRRLHLMYGSAQSFELSEREGGGARVSISLPIRQLLPGGGEGARA